MDNKNNEAVDGVVASEEISLEEQQAVLEKFDQESNTRNVTGFAKGFIKWYAIAMAVFHVYTSFFGLWATIRQRAMHLLFVMPLCYLMYPAKKGGARNNPSLLDWVFAALSFVCCGYIVVNYDAIFLRGGLPNQMDIIMGCLCALLVLEAVRRVVGTQLLIIAVIFLGYALLRGIGKTDAEIRRPQVAIISAWSDINNGHSHLNDLAKDVEKGIIEAGGTPYHLPTIGLCDGLAFYGSQYILPSRDLIANEVETQVEGYKMDAMVLMASCDKIVPAYVMAAARLNIPAVIVTGGYMVSGNYNGKKISFVDVGRAVGQVQSGSMTMNECMEILDCACPGPGACPMMGTANTMCIIAEALGMTMPGNSTICARDPKIHDMAYRAGKTVMELWDKGITARNIITQDSIENAIMACMAMGGSTNSLIHVPAMATEAGLDDFDCIGFFDKASYAVPLLMGVEPNGPHLMEDFERAGGLAALFKTIESKIHADALTVTGQTLGQRIQDAKVLDETVIHPLSDPISTEGALAVLRGNIAVDGAIVKQSAVPACLMKFRGPVVVFEDVDDAIAGLREGKIRAGNVVVIRMQGAKGGPGVVTTFPFTSELAGTPLYDKVALVTDGRFSGATEGASIGYVSPEAALMGPLLIVEQGDIISYDIDKRTIQLELSDEEIQRRLDKAELNINYYPGWLGIYQKAVGSITKGGVLSGKN